MGEDFKALAGFIAGHPQLMPIVGRMQNWALPDCCLVAGEIHQNVWNAITGRAPGHG